MNETAEERALSFLGLCMRAGQVVSGQEACVAAIRGGECALALLDAGAEGRVERGEAELLLPDRDVDVALCGFRLLAENFPQNVEFKEV